MRGRVYTSAKDPNSLTHPLEPGSHTALMPEIPGTSMHSEKPFKSECCTRPNQEVTQKTPGPDCCAWLSRPHPQAADAHLPSPECATVSSTTPWGAARAVQGKGHRRAPGPIYTASHGWAPQTFWLFTVVLMRLIFWFRNKGLCDVAEMFLSGSKGASQGAAGLTSVSKRW